jgi:DNA-binding MarR family transcriptional regulator
MTDDAAGGHETGGDFGVDAALDIADIDEVTSAMLTASRLLVAISAKSLAAVEDTVTLPQFRLLVVLSTRSPAKLVALAQALGVNPSTAMRMVDRLATAGLISRQASPHSGREISIELTDTGRAVVDGVTDRRRAEIADVIVKMPTRQRHALVEVLRAFTNAGGEPPVATLIPLGWA